MLGMFALLSACQADKDQTALKKEIGDLEKAYENKKAKEAASHLPLVAKYNEYLDKYPDDKAMTPRYLYRVASIYYKEYQMDNALAFLEKVLNNYDHDEVSPRSLMLKGKVYQEQNNITQSIIAFGELIRKYPNHPAAEEAKKLLPDEKVLQNKIAKLETMIEDTTVAEELNRGAYPQLSAAYIQYVATLPDAADAPERLYKAGKYYAASRNFANAVDTWKKVMDQYPKSGYAKNALFEAAYSYENILKNPEEARKMYEMFLKKYPNDNLAPSAKFSLDNLGKSADELLNIIQEKNKGKE